MDLELISGIINIIIINLVLSGDNAVVIAMAAMGLPENQRKKAIFWGATLAVILRIFLTFVAAMLLKIPFVQFVGGLLLAWIAVKLLYPEEEHGEAAATGTSSFTKAMMTILWADLVMSLDNVLAVAGAAKGNLTLLIFGLVISVPIVLAGSTLLTKLMARYSWLAYVGAGILAWTAGHMIVEDKAITNTLHAIPFSDMSIPVLLTALVIYLGWRARTKPASEEA